MNTQQKTKLSTDVTIGMINQVVAELIGYQLFYKDDYNKFTGSLDIESFDMGTIVNPLVHVEQVGKIWSKK